MAPELLMPPEKAESVTDAKVTPPTTMPLKPAETVPELLMPPVKAPIVTDPKVPPPMRMP
jgi:hypothetical protein